MPAEIPYLESNYINEAKERGVEFEPRPIERVVITGYASMTPLGNDEESWDKMLEGVSGVTKVSETQIGGQLPDDYDPLTELKGRGKQRGQSQFSAAVINLSREALDRAGVLAMEGEHAGKLDPTIISPYQASSWVTGGYAASDQMIEVHKRIQPGSKEKVNPDLSLQIFPEQGNGRNAEAVGFRGSGGNTMEACATGASNIIEAYYRVKDGRSKIALAGGFEMVMKNHPLEMFAAFGSLQALSTWIDTPAKASRPFDTNRNGFVSSSGGGVVNIEPLEQALERGAPIYAEILGVGKGMDGFKPTELNPQRVADTIAEALFDRKTGRLRRPDVILAHATSTELGDLNESEALRLVLGMEELKGIPVSAIKSLIGHMLGGAGSFNIIAALHVLREQKVPKILNLDNPDERILNKGLYLLKDDIYTPPVKQPIESVLTTAYGFGGYNAIVHLGRYHPLSMAQVA